MIGKQSKTWHRPGQLCNIFYAYQFSFYRYQVAGDGFVLNGKLVFRCWADEHFDKLCNGLVPIGQTFPTSHPENWLDVAHEESQRLLTLLEMKTGALNFDFVFDEDGRFYFLELGPRNGGCLIPEVIRYATNIDLIKYTVDAALGLPCNGLKMKPAQGFWSSYMLHSLESGVFKDLWVSEKMRAKVVEQDVWVKPGDRVEKYTGSNHTLGTMILKFETLEEMIFSEILKNLNVEKAQSRLSRALEEREDIGGVNLRADIELEEQNKRLSILSKERDDLFAAVKKLKAAIEEINAEGREKLINAFDIVNRHFIDLFTTLFEGGNAHLALTETEDPLGGGLEVYACPPGKRLSSMSLMSGGEQALTATALIFAVFLSNPAPISVLDELDAPLDDANVDRFCKLMDEKRKRTDTRFICITHHPITMARMDRLFGVTMAERGVSNVVSVDLSRAQTMIDNAFN